MICPKNKVTIFILSIIITHVTSLPNGCTGGIEWPGVETDISVTCTNVSFHDTIEHFRGLKFRVLQFGDCSKPIGRLQSLPSINVYESFAINNCGITEIDDGVFADVSVMPDVSMLEFGHNKITKMPVLGFKPQMLMLILNDNKISHIPDGIFFKNTYVPSLRYIDLNHNLLTEIGEFAFFGSKLDDLDVSYNQIVNIAPAAFSPFNLWDLNLSHNRLEELPPQLFWSSQQLVIVELHGNKLKQLPANLFTYNKKLYQVDVSDNELEKTDREGLRAWLGVSDSTSFEQ